MNSRHQTGGKVTRLPPISQHMAATPPQDLRDQYDVVVIGGGLGGMTAANILARAGHSVLLAEHHHKLGGLATWFRRGDGRVFDVALHGFPVGMIKSCRRYWTSEIADSIVQLKDIRFDNPMFWLSTSFDRQDFTRLLVERFRVLAANVEGFFDAARNMNFYDDQATTTGSAFRAVLPRPRGHRQAADGADHLCQRLDARRPGTELWHRLFQLHVEGRLHLPGRHRTSDRVMGQELKRSGVDVRTRMRRGEDARDRTEGRGRQGVNATDTSRPGRSSRTPICWPRFSIL